MESRDLVSVSRRVTTFETHFCESLRLRLCLETNLETHFASLGLCLGLE